VGSRIDAIMGASLVFESGFEADFKPDLLKFEIRIKTGF